MYYPVEMYVKALERMSIELQVPIELPKENEDALVYAQDIIHQRACNSTIKSCFRYAAEMLQMLPETLWLLYPEYFPEPRQGVGAVDKERV